MRILVTFAVEAEFAPWRKLRRFRKESRGPMDCFSSKMNGGELTVLLTGIGCRKGWIQASQLVWLRRFDICVSSGLAGGLRPDHTIAEILAPQEVLASNLDRVIPCDPKLVDCAVAQGAKRVSAFYSADRVVVPAREKKHLGALGDAVEMESGKILARAAACGARVVAARAISDTCEEDLPIDFNKVATEDGGVSLRKILGRAAGSPGSIPSLIRFGQQSRRAAESLAEFLERFVPQLVATASPKISEEVAL